MLPPRPAASNQAAFTQSTWLHVVAAGSPTKVGRPGSPPDAMPSPLGARGNLSPIQAPSPFLEEPVPPALPARSPTQRGCKVQDPHPAQVLAPREWQK